MIVLSEDGGKNLVKIESWEDIEERPAFRSDINPAEIKLKEIIGKYSLVPMPTCGLSSCHRVHNRGYLVVCEGGIETNIGHLCGFKHFEVRWRELEKQFNLAYNANRYRDNLHSKLKQLDRLSEAIQTIIPENVATIYGNVRRLVETTLPDDISQRLKDRAKRNQPLVYTEIELTEEERDFAREAGGDIAARQELIFRIDGLSAVNGYNRLRNLVEVTLTTEFSSFKNIDPDILTYNELQWWHKWANKLEPNIAETESLIEACSKFVSHDNTLNIRSHPKLL